MTNILILSFQLLFSTPTNDFTGYYGPNTNQPSWYVSSNICWTAVLEFNGPPGTYEVWWNNTAALLPPVPFSDGSGWIGQAPIHIDDRVVHTNDLPQTIVIPVVPEPLGSFRLRKV
jgi:hypothetical protein